ncbi:MAG TPA: prolyl oligopeptidase family serine peptidase [Chitinophagaceae bacterium]|nr:prolyl oligopeptidase family serine peptidase [Chitinophagaceae bacterium]
MTKKILTFLLLLVSLFSFSQRKSDNHRMTPELLWKLGRVSGIGITKDGKSVVYAVSIPDMGANKSNRYYYMLPIDNGAPVEISNPDSLLNDKNISPDGKYMISSKEVKIKNVTGADYYPDLSKSNVYIYDNLMYRHWDTWEDGKFGHVFLSKLENGKATDEKDLMPDEPYDCPQKPFGGDEDYVWNPDGKHVVYCTKKEYGTAYTISTNTDLYEYNIETGATKNLTEKNKGYDISPEYSKNGTLAWLQMKTPGYEADKQDIVAFNGIGVVNLTGHRDDINVEGFRWADDGKHLFFWAATNGTFQLFEVDYSGATMKLPDIRQITKGDFDVNGIVGQSGNLLIVTRSDFNHANEIYSVDITNGSMKQLTHINDAVYNSIGLCKSERRFVKTVDNKQMLVWVVYPPDFDPSKKYPTLLYCQGGPQVSLTQFYSFRWNFQLMASQGYIVVAPCRRGMAGFGTKWNAQVSKDWGGLVMQDYLSAIDAISKEKFVDKNRRGCVGASFGGFSVFELAGMHNGRFKTFIAHDGVFDFRSMYGTTDEMWFENWEKGGSYWDKNNAVAQRSFSQSPSNFVAKWNTPILIVEGGKDFRVPVGQGQQAFQAAQLRGIKSKFLFLPDENHWVLAPQNALVWQREFFKWLDETLE